MPTSLLYRAICLCLSLALWASSALAGASDTVDPKVKVDLVAKTRSIVPGKPLNVGLRQTIQKDWHTYWKNPGDSGLPTRITWELPEGFTASEIQWPFPEALPYGPLVNYGYSNNVLLPVTITPPKTIESPVVALKAKAEWLVCKDICIPESTDLELKLRVAPPGSEGLPSAAAKDFERAQRTFPIASPWPVTALVNDKFLQIRLDAPQVQQDRVQSIRFFPTRSGHIENAAEQITTWTKQGPQVTAARISGGSESASNKVMDGVLVITENTDGQTVQNGFTISAPLTTAKAGELRVERGKKPKPASTTGLSLWQALLFAAIGGMILNLMPCVLPILSLKVMSLARHGGERNGASAKSSGLWYTAGILVSFALLALLIIALKSAGTALGWGFQFQSPVFVLVMACLFFMLALSLSGVFDITTGLEGAGDNLTNDNGPRSSFFTGALASIAATPCTAPFMGAAIGYALTRPPAELFLILQALGLGFALPMLALSYSGAATKYLPKPGPWMETLKQVLAFPLYATVAWLVWVLTHQAGSTGVLAAAIVLVTLGFAAWLMGRSDVSMAVRASIVALVVLFAFATAIPMLNEGYAIKAASTTATAESFTQQRVDDLRASGRPVLVNFTAAWCITCKVNEQVALKSNDFFNAMKRKNVAYLKGDWTLQDPKITRVLESFGRSGVPLYVLYPADLGAKPIVLPQLLTPGTVQAQLEKLPSPTTR